MKQIVALLLIGLMGFSVNAQDMENEATAAAEAYFESLVAEDLAAITDLLTEDAVLVSPYTLSGDHSTPTVYDGREAVVAYFTNIFDRFALSFEAMSFSPVVGGEVVFVELQGDFVVEAAPDLHYRNLYVVKMYVSDDGHIIRIDEYFNPITTAVTFGLPMGADAE